MKFKDIVATRDKDFMDTIYSFGTVEGEVYAYTRWLRARKYVLEDTLKMVEEATACRMAPKMDNFYPDPNEALGCDTSTYLSQYPQLYSGFAKNGAPLFISKPGALAVIFLYDCKERIWKGVEEFKKAMETSNIPLENVHFVTWYDDYEKTFENS